jgi:phosphatidylinositol glycan class N
MLHKEKIVFFLHLLGIDSNGHSHRPYSEQYLNNIKVVDDGLRKMQDLVDGFYENDGKTAYVLASDHGMSNRGSHGDGDPDNTETPLVVWGAGIKKADFTNPTGHDDKSISWKLESVQRNDIAQADVAPLMVSIFFFLMTVNLDWCALSNEFSGYSSIIFLGEF